MSELILYKINTFTEFLQNQSYQDWDLQTQIRFFNWLGMSALKF